MPLEGRASSFTLFLERLHRIGTMPFPPSSVREKEHINGLENKEKKPQAGLHARRE